MTGSDRVNRWASSHGSGIGEDGEGQGGEDGEDERTHCNECGGVLKRVGGVA